MGPVLKMGQFPIENGGVSIPASYVTPLKQLTVRPWKMMIARQAEWWPFTEGWNVLVSGRILLIGRIFAAILFGIPQFFRNLEVGYPKLKKKRSNQTPGGTYHTPDPWNHPTHLVYERKSLGPYFYFWGVHFWGMFQGYVWNFLRQTQDSTESYKVQW